MQSWAAVSWARYPGVVSGTVHTRAVFDVVCVAASLGGVAAHSELLASLPDTFPAAIVVVQHRPARERDGFAEVLRYRSALPVRLLEEGDELTAGVVHVVPGGLSATITPDGISLHQVADRRTANPDSPAAAGCPAPRRAVRSAR